MKIGAYGERAVEIVLDGPDARRARAVAEAIERAHLDGVVECVSGYGATLIHARPGASLDLDAVRDVAESAEDSEETREATMHVVPAVYDGVDLEDVARRCGLEVGELVRRHAARAYEVEVIGFLPGFAYLGDVDPSLRVPRLAAPRTRVGAGSIGIAGAKTAIYPLDSPGGWRIVGRAVGVSPFDPARAPPSLFLPGDRVRFEPIDAPVRTAERSSRQASAETSAARALVVETIGPGATLQDGGRVGVARWGVPLGGPLDEETFEACLCSVGERGGGTAIELPLLGARFRARGAMLVGVDGEERKMRDGETLEVPRSERAVRYVAVRGGFDVPKVLGARGTLLGAHLGGFHGRALRVGDALPVGDLGDLGALRARSTSSSRTRATSIVSDAALECVPTIDGDASLFRALLEREWRVDPRSDRVGTRLDGEPLLGARGAMLSRPTARGAIQLPPDGRPIVLGPDGPTTGGYPVIAVLRGAACAALARVRPGGRVRFAVARARD